MGTCASRRGFGQSQERLDRSEETVEAYVMPLTFSEENRSMVAALRAAARRGGLKEFWKRRLHFLLEEPQVRIGSVASAYLKAGDRDRALQWLEKLYTERGARIRSLKVNPEWDSIRAEPRFSDLIRRANMAPPTRQLLSRRPWVR